MFRNNPGFTLIELLITFSLLAILTAGVISVIGPQPKRTARDARRSTDLQSIAGALEMYRNDNSGYPLQASWKTALTTNKYIASVPKDPKSAADYTYNAPSIAVAGTDCVAQGSCNATRCTTYCLCSANFENRGTTTTKCVTNP